ncbi:glucose-1-phosphate adenylyltransferase [Planctomicrobium piriforme]|uniref:Glucose-1-phosphate adenylyltransferase n=1 Tax=Planctomicrobium piriforme TaxID=1576369 RepID=A0A1I3PCS4_9PLAN|nr:glucose-1-phosphate adenylyltransferase [Planctomicrobium piriforme]SFJ19120.1 glucose-1-phosphate adenylyltransferase [Planctomicrobium piriforme]
MQDVLTLILAGGKGTRLEPLTNDRAKPGVPFAGTFRIIDFPLSNCINSGLRRVLVMTQYKAASLDRHLRQAWQFLCRELDEFIDILPPQQRLGEHWYRGTADAVYQNIYTIEQCDAKHILILSGDHIYKMDYSKMIAEHLENDADCTIGCLPVSMAEGRSFGVMGIDSDYWVRRFEEKPKDPFPIPGDPERCLASMGIYVFKASFLLNELCREATNPESSHDFGKDIIPQIISTHRVRAYPFQDRNTGDEYYWRDVGTLEAYYEAHMDLVSVDPQLNMYDYTWPIRGYHAPLPPPKFVFASYETIPRRVGHALDSIVCPGSIVSGGEVVRSVLSPNVRINSYSQVNASILFDEVDVGRHAKVQRAIIDKGVKIPAGMQIGFDPEQDLARGLTVTESGITVVPKWHKFSE